MHINNKESQMLLISDLKEPCTQCQGSGFQAGFNQYGSILPNNSRKCQVCQGRGHLLTKLGKEIWDLYNPMIKEIISEMINERPPKAFIQQIREDDLEEDDFEVE